MAIEKAQHEEEMALLARERARAEFQDLEKKEEEFYFDQSKVRSEIRLRKGRIKPIDLLYKQLNDVDEFDIDIHEAYTVFKGLAVKEMEDLRDDIKMHLDLNRETPTHIEYWEALLMVCDWELAEARKKDALDRARVREKKPSAELLAEERGVHSSIEADVKNVKQGKSRRELEEYQFKIQSDMRSRNAKVVEYWEAILKRLHIYKAKACLRELHTKNLRKYLLLLEQHLENEDYIEENKISTPTDEDSEDVEGSQPLSTELILDEETHEVKLDEEEEDEDAGSYSPELLHGDDNEEAIDPEEDKMLMEQKCKTVLEEQQRRIQETMVATKPTRIEDNLQLKTMKVMGTLEDGEEIFGSGAELNVDSQVYWWNDKYRPKNPKYFNRVHAGYEWNKYKQTHCDHDNPPPKILQGYKFNIFYPDLIDKIKAFVFTIEKDGDSVETCIVRFHADPPYEDIAFRVVNK